MLSVTQSLADLRAKPLNVPDAKRTLQSSELKDKKGIYAWWCRHAKISEVPTNPHPVQPQYDILYVGVSPKDEFSRGMLRTQIVGNHLSGNTGSSTFRYALAAMLIDELNLSPSKRGKKYLLTDEDNSRLSEWQSHNLVVSWCEHDSPWSIEAEVIKELQPPLNCDKNASHLFYPFIKSVRARFRERTRV